MGVLKCGPGNKPCGKRCIPQEHVCGGKKELSGTTKTVGKILLTAAGVGLVIGAISASKKSESVKNKEGAEVLGLADADMPGKPNEPLAGKGSREEANEALAKSITLNVEAGELVKMRLESQMTSFKPDYKLTSQAFIKDQLDKQNKSAMIKPVSLLEVDDIGKLPGAVAKKYAGAFNRDGYVVLGDVLVTKGKPSSDKLGSGLAQMYSNRQARIAATITKAQGSKYEMDKAQKVRSTMEGFLKQERNSALNKGIDDD
jgi:hypothetical protein